MLAPVTTFAQMGQGYGDHMHGWDDGAFWWMVVPMTIFGLVLLGAIAWGVVALTRSGGVQHPTAPSGPTAREVLDQRYARGEIETADYEERRRLLE